MAASQYDFSIEQGTSFKLSLIYKDSDNNPINISGYCARIIWKTNTNKVQSFSTDNTDDSLYKFKIQESNVTGKIGFELPASVTNDFAFTNAKYDFELESPDEAYTGGGNFVIRILFGTINIVKRYSKSDTLLDCSA